MLRISFTPPDELYISGAVQDMKAVCAQLNELAKGDKTEVLIAADGKANPAPYNEALTTLMARVTSGPTKVTVENRNVDVVGSQESFVGFACFFGFDESVSSGAHNHHEYYEGNPHIHFESVPLVIGIRNSK